MGSPAIKEHDMFHAVAQNQIVGDGNADDAGANHHRVNAVG